MMLPAGTSGQTRELDPAALVQTLRPCARPRGRMSIVFDRARAEHVAILTLAILGTAAGLVSVWLGWSAPSFSRWATSIGGLLAGMAAGWSLIVVGASRWMRSGDGSGVLMLAAGGAWALTEWVNPGSAPAAVFTVGLLFGAAWPALVAHAALEWSDQRPTRLALGLIALGYVSNVIALGLLPALAFDPAASGCTLCPPSLVGVASDQSLVAFSTRVGLAIQALWAPAVAVVLLRHALRRPGARASGRLVRVAVAVALLAVAADAVYAFQRGFKSNNSVDMAIWWVQALALLAIGMAGMADLVRARRTRQAVAKLALDLASAPPAGELGKALGRLLNDPTLAVAYPLDDDEFVDAHGALARLPEEGSGRETTTVLRGGVAVACLIHSADRLRDEARVSDALATARLALENERLQAISRARLRDLRASRAQIVSASDAERRRLERDLHDGSQQRLLGLAIELAIARQRTINEDPSVAAGFDALEAEVRGALADLRTVAHGIYPRTLADDGLAPALEELAETAPVQLDLLAVPVDRLDPRIEAVAYLVVARVIAEASGGRASVDARRVGDVLVVDVEAAGQPGHWTDLEDRVGALDGTVTINSSADDRIHLHAEIPCAS